MPGSKNPVKKSKILIIAPQPFFMERGTPLNVRALAESLSEIGYFVDVLCYPLGKDISINNVRLLRGFPIPFISDVPAGPSWRKVLLDIGLGLRALPLFLTRRYSMLHGIEEGAFFVGVFGFLTRTPYIVDLDSCMKTQLQSSGFLNSKILLNIFSGFESWFMHKASGVLTVCQSLTQKAKNLNIKAPIYQIEDFPVDSSKQVEEERVEDLRKEFNLQNKKVLVYTGNFQSYQGLDLLLETLDSLFVDSYARENIRAVLIGGEGAQDPLLSQYREQVKEKGLADYVICPGPMPMSEMGNVMALSDVLVSPRSEGENTPLKIYSYMASGRAIVATNLETHTQVLDDNTAFLVQPNPKVFAAKLLEVLGSGEASHKKRLEVGQNAKKLVEERYSKSSFNRRVGEFYADVFKYSQRR